MKISLAFFLALCALFFNSLIFPGIRLIAFAPFLALVFQKKDFLPSLWIALGCGLFIDLCTTDVRFGLFSLGYLLTACLCHKQRNLFYEERIFSLSFYTILISACFSIIQFSLMTSFNRKLYFNAVTAFNNFLLMPLLDGISAFFWFTCPLLLYTVIAKKLRSPL